MCQQFPGIKNKLIFFLFYSLECFKYIEIVSFKTCFPLFPLMSCSFLLGWLRTHTWPAVQFPQPICTSSGCSVIFKACLLSDKVSSTQSLSTSAVFFEVNQRVLPSGTNGNLPERNNYCTWKIYWSTVYGSSCIWGLETLFKTWKINSKDSDRVDTGEHFWVFADAINKITEFWNHCHKYQLSRVSSY